MRRISLPLALMAALVVVPSANAAQPIVPRFIQALVAKRAGDLAYVPTRVMPFYRYRSFNVDRATKQVTYRFARVRPGANQPPFTVTVKRYSGKLEACGNDKQQTLQMGGNRVYWNGVTAWRCLPFLGGAARVGVISADPAKPGSKFAYGRVAASIKRIAR